MTNKIKLFALVLTLILILGFTECQNNIVAAVVNEQPVETPQVPSKTEKYESDTEDLSNQTLEEFLQEMYYDIFEGEENVKFTAEVEEAMRGHFTELQQARKDDDSVAINEAYKKMDDIMRAAGLDIPFKSFLDFVESIKDEFTEEAYNEIVKVYEEADELYNIGDIEGSDKLLAKIEKYFIPLGYDNIEKLVEEKDSGINILAVYDVIDGKLELAPVNKATSENIGKKNIEEYKKIWEHILKAIPADYLDIIVSLDISTDGREENLAAIFPIEEDNKEFAISVDPVDAYDENGNFYGEDYYGTLVHEFGHILTLNSTQFKAERDEDSPTLTLEEGTFTEDSYMNIFFQRFWTDIYDELRAFQEKDGEGEPDYTSDDFYEKYKDQFVTDYASTNPAEDMAESYRLFIMSDKPEGNAIADQKVLFFYEFDETVKQRKEIRKNIGLK